LELGLERAGLGPVKWQVEIDDYCNKVLEKHWPKVKRYGDIKSIREGELEPVDIICGGFPCQPVSVAGARKGDEDERWLWPEFARVLRMVKPGWVVAENVPGLLTANSGGAMGEVLRDLALCGYSIESDCISAQSVGAWHRRDRIFIVAHSGCAHGREGMEVEGAIPRMLEDGEARDFTQRSGTTWTISDADTDGREGQNIYLRRGRPFEAPPLISGGRADVPDPESEGGERGETRLGIFDSQRATEILRWCRARNVSDAKSHLRLPSGNEGHETSDWCGAKYGCGIWSVEPGLGRVADGVSHRMDRLKCLGNAVVPQVAEVVGRLIIEAEGRSEA
jgi:DNA (cytosine-5)-methyltransferase 1